MFKYDPPAKVDDLAGRPTHSAFLDAWHRRINGNFTDEIGNLPRGIKLFFSETSSPATGAEIPVTWNAFPLHIKREHPSDAESIARWEAADKLGTKNRGVGAVVQTAFRPQDEYCEWHAYRDTPGGPITRIVFTAEAPEYWIELARQDFERVVQLYQQHVSPLVKADDLRLAQDIDFGGEILPKGTYNPYNKWNTTDGGMHLTHPANTLGAEIDLAARATIPRRNATGKRVTDVRRFACGSDFGDPNRSSDPNIGLGVNLTVLPTTAGSAAVSITLANPVGLYIDSIRSGVITDEDDDPLSGWFNIVRGGSGRGLMAVLAPTEGASFGLDKVHILGKPLTHGGQVAEQIQMVLYARTANLGHAVPPLQPCVAHCCRSNNSTPVDLVNLGQLDSGSTCPDPSKDPFPELTGATVPVAAPRSAVTAAAVAVRPRRPSRLTRRSGDF